MAMILVHCMYQYHEYFEWHVERDAEDVPEKDIFTGVLFSYISPVFKSKFKTLQKYLKPIQLNNVDHEKG